MIHYLDATKENGDITSLCKHHNRDDEFSAFSDSVNCARCISIIQGRNLHVINDSLPKIDDPSLLTWENLSDTIKTHHSLIPRLLAKALMFGDEHDLKTHINLATKEFSWSGGISE